MQTTKITDDVIISSRELLSAMGIPFLTAPSEGEAQASYMASKGDVWAAGSQDFDALLFGAPHLVRNMTISGRRKLPRQQRYVEVLPELIHLEVVLSELGIDRTQLVGLAVLAGTDFNPGIKGIGPKKALKLIVKHGDIGRVISEKQYDIPNLDEVLLLFLQPEVTDDYSLEWPAPDEERMTALLCDGHEFSESRVGSSINKMRKYREAASQRSLEDFF
jgi:flap endonuclease-1